LKVENFRSIESAEVRLGPITVLFGATSAGKSSLFYALLALRNFVLNSNQSSDGFFNLGFQNLGGFDACVFNHSPSKDISVTADFGPSIGRYGVRIGKTEGEILLGAGGLEMTAKVSIPYGMNQSWTNAIIESTALAQEASQEEYAINWNGFASTVSPKQATAESQARAMSITKSLNAPVEALRRVDICPHRRGFFKPTYTAVSLTPTPTTEDEVATLIINNQDAPPRISINTTEIFDRDFRTHTVPGTATTFLKTTELSGARVPGDLVNDGFGVNQVVYLLAKIHRPEVQTIFIEEPEVHLHPSVIRKLAQTLCRLAKEEEKQMIMTTHSEQLLIALLACVKQGLLKPEELVCYEATREKKRTQFKPRRVSADGQLEGGLSSFLDGELEDLKTLLAVSA
jgi:hypothetical protein